VFKGIDNIIAMPGSCVSAFPQAVPRDCKLIANFGSLVNEESIPVTIDGNWAIIE